VKNKKEKIGDLDDHNSKLVKLLVENLEEKSNLIQKKDVEIQEKDKEIQEKNKIIQEKDIINQGKDDLIQRKDNFIQQKDSFIELKDNTIQEQKKVIQNVQDEIQKVVKKLKEQDKEIQKIQEQDEETQKIQEKDNIIQEKDNIIQEKDSIIQEKDSIIQEKDNKIQELVKEIQEKDKTIQEKDNKIQKIVEEKDKKIQEKDKVIQDLEQGNSKFKKEASEYQYALGAATNFRLSDDDDKHNSIKLKDDIIKLQHSLENYITKCKGNMEIYISGIQNLLRKYGSNTIISIDQKPLIKAVLQRHVIEQIFKYGEEYFDFNNLHNYKEHGIGTETYLYNQTYELMQLAEVFALERDGIDETTKILPIKLRQQVCASLGNRGFSDILNRNYRTPHDFIRKCQFNLNNEINKYRILKDSEKKREIEYMAGEIIRKVITLFWFRFEIQEPIAQYCWFNCNDNINPNYMEGTWEDDEIDNIAVDICYFPLIRCNDGSKRQIYTTAKILHKRKY
jgi:hypothetical protein